MREFINEELHCIEEALFSTLKAGEEASSYTSRLILKIRSMIAKPENDMSFTTVYQTPKLTLENFHEVLSQADGIYKCIKCKSKDIDENFIIKYGLHEWLLCKKCSSKFMYLVRNKGVLEDIPEGYGHWTVEIPERFKK